MRKDDLERHLKLVIPSLYKFAMAIVPSAELSRELIADAYSVYLIKKADHLLSVDINTKLEEKKFRKAFMKDLLKEIYRVGVQNIETYKECLEAQQEFKSFYRLNIRERSFSILNSYFRLSEKDVEEIFGLKHHEFIELKYHCTEALLRDYQEALNSNEVASLRSEVL